MRNLTPQEVSTLQQQSCTATDWQLVLVDEPFQPALIQNVAFTGRVYLGSGVTLRNISSLGSTGHTTFANGVEVGVLREDGGMEVVIHDELSSMEAAFEVLEAQREPALVKQLQQAARDKAALKAKDGSVIEAGAVVTDVRQLTDVHIGAAAHVVGAVRLEDVSLCSRPDAASGVGDGVILEHVIVSEGSHIGDGAQLDNCFVGQGCHIGRMYSATQSLFFANCHFENGEACAYFAGPYSVSHHKATLMIACMTSFFNAGSGSNQSNHSYKMGPNKYGQLQRGAKLGSSSYVYWPMQVGAFSTVIGHHTGHQNLCDLPFSLVTEGPEGTHIIPGQAFRSVGTRRDSAKWPKRDKRPESARRDLICFDMLNPYTVGYILRGLDILRGMKAQGQNDYQGCRIASHHITRGIALYQQALDIYVGQALERLAATSAPLIAVPTDEVVGDWADYGGMIVPRQRMLNALRDGQSFADLQQILAVAERDWLAAHFDISDADALIARSHEALDAWNASLDEDAERDLEAASLVLS